MGTALRVAPDGRHSATTHRARSGHAPPLAHDRLARALGWASLAVGVPQALSPGRVTAALGTGDGPRQRTAAVLVGVRELIAAAGLLRRPSPAWLWLRVGGDAMDLALLARARDDHDVRRRRRTAAATASVVALAAVDLYAAITRTRKNNVVQLTATTTIRKRPDDVYAFWHRLENLPTFMGHLDEVRSTGSGRSRWKASAPFGRNVEWDAVVLVDVPGERIAWESIAGARVANAGEVLFVPAPGGRGTEVHVAMSYEMPAGRLGEAIARYFGEDPHQQLDDDLRRFKQVMETGEVVRSEGAPGGKRARHEFPQHPARPLTHDELRKGAYV